MTKPLVQIRTYLLVFLALLVLLALTLSASFLNLGRSWSLLVALAVALSKTLLILLYFMHVRHSSRLTWVFAGVGFFWLGILLVLALSDYLSREWLAIPGK